jgi:FtsP/CotA-like multicopper oxidase with cupredoxin domain
MRFLRKLCLEMGRAMQGIDHQSGQWTRIEPGRDPGVFGRQRGDQLDAHPFMLIGVDGGLLPSPLEMEALLLTPGERVDVIVRGNRNPGSHRLWNTPYSRTAGMWMGGPMFRSNGPFELAQIDYEFGDQAFWQLPERLARIDPLPSNGKVRRFSLAQAMAGMGMPGRAQGGVAFTINGRTFDMDMVDTQVQPGEVEDWEFVNNTILDHEDMGMMGTLRIA